MEKIPETEQKELHEKQSLNNGESWIRGPLLGKGSFGSVHLATTKKPESQLSSFPPQMAVKSAKYSVSSTLQKERKILTDLRNCPHVIRCFGEEITKGENNKKVYNLLLEYAHGGSLHDLIYNKSCKKRLPESDVRRYTRSILEGIKHVHDMGYVHHDIKPANILLVAEGTSYYEAKLCDFGLAKKAKDVKEGAYLRGTPSYMSPEAAVEGVQGPSCDIWALGCVVLEMLTRKKAWKRDESWSTATFIGKIGYEFEKPKIPRYVSKEGKEFLECCFERNAELRLTANELLKLPFLSVPNREKATNKLARFWCMCEFWCMCGFTRREDAIGDGPEERTARV